MVSGPIVIDRTRVAELLGLGEPVRHALYGYLNVDVHVDTLGVLALTAGTVMRLALDLYQWSSSDVGVMSFAPEFYGGSFVMPQKRNPTWLEPVRRGAFSVKGCQDQALEMFMHSPPMVLVGAIPVPGLLHRATEELRYALDLLSAALATTEIDAERSGQLATQDFTQAAQLANLLVASRQATWRQAQRVVGQLVQEALQDGRTPQELDPRRMEEIAQARLRAPVTVADEEFRSALDPAELVRTRTDCGPAPDAVAAALGWQRDATEGLRHRVAQESDRIAQVWKTLDDKARAL